MSDMNELIEKISERKGLYDAILDAQRQAGKGTLTKKEYVERLRTLFQGAGIEVDIDQLEAFVAQNEKIEISGENLKNVVGGNGNEENGEYPCSPYWAPCPKHCSGDND